MLRTIGPLLRHLPGIYRHPEAFREAFGVAAEPGALRAVFDLLSAFEEIFFGPAKGDFEGLEQKIARIPDLFNPVAHDAGEAFTPFEFLPWLSQWVALSDAHGLSEDRLRALIARIVPLYSMRGTKGYMETLLPYFLPANLSVVIDDSEPRPFTVGLSLVGTDSWLGGGEPYWFSVKVVQEVPETDAETADQIRARYEAIIESVINLAKPAHTAYRLEWENKKTSREGGVIF